MTEKFWFNSDNDLFVINGQPKYLPCVGILKVEWLIGDPRRGARATIVLQGQLLQASELFDLKDGISLDVVHHECGDKTKYVADSVVARFSNCEILNSWIDNLVVTYMELSKVVTLFVRIQADFEILEPEE